MERPLNSTAGRSNERDDELDAARQRQRRGLAAAGVKLDAADVELEYVLDVGGEDVARLGAGRRLA